MLNSAMTALTRNQWTATFRPYLAHSDSTLDSTWLGVESRAAGRHGGRCLTWQPCESDWCAALLTEPPHRDPCWGRSEPRHAVFTRLSSVARVTGSVPTVRVDCEPSDNCSH